MININTISNIERFLCDLIISSQLIPPVVQVLRIADELDLTGTVQQSTYITVKYAGTTVKPILKQNTRLMHSMSFEIEIGAQDYLSHNGHDFATQLLLSCQNIIINKIPPATGFSVDTPFMLVNESFKGITQQNQYVYLQKWELKLVINYEPLPVDPCVAMGHCNNIWAGVDIVNTLPDGFVVDNQGRLYTPVSSGDEPIRDIDGVLYNPDDNSIILNPGERLVPVVAEIGDEITAAHVVDSQGNYIRTIPIYRSSKVLLKLRTCLFRSEIGKLTVSEKSTLDWSHTFQTDRDWTLARLSRNSLFYYDPITNNHSQQVLEESSVIAIVLSVSITVDGNLFYLAKLPNNTTGWVRADFVYIIDRLKALTQEACTNLDLLNELEMPPT